MRASRSRSCSRSRSRSRSSSPVHTRPPKGHNLGDRVELNQAINLHVAEVKADRVIRDDLKLQTLEDLNTIIDTLTSKLYTAKAYRAKVHDKKVGLVKRFYQDDYDDRAAGKQKQIKVHTMQQDYGVPPQDHLYHRASRRRSYSPSYDENNFPFFWSKDHKFDYKI